MSAGLRGGRGDVLRGSHGDVAGVESGASSVERSTSEHGNHLGSARAVAASDVALGWAHRRPTGLGWGGAAVVTSEAGRAGHRAKGGSGIEKRLETAMPKEAPLNGDAPTVDDNIGDVPVGPRRRVSEMQAKLHRWAVADPGRRFDDLFATLGPGCLNQPTAETMESPLR